MPNKSLQAFESRGGRMKRVWFCHVEPKAEGPNAWERHESTEPSMKRAERNLRLTRDGRFRRRYAMARQASSAIAEDVIRPARLSLDVKRQVVLNLKSIKL